MEKPICCKNCGWSDSFYRFLYRRNYQDLNNSNPLIDDRKYHLSLPVSLAYNCEVIEEVLHNKCVVGFKYDLTTNPDYVCENCATYYIKFIDNNDNTLNKVILKEIK